MHQDGIAKLAAILVVAIGTSFASFSTTNAQSGYFRGINRYKVPDITLIDMDGRKVSIRQELLESSPAILQFMFATCSGICPIDSAVLAGAQARLQTAGSNARFWSISIDPEADTPDRLQLYAQSLGAGPHWRFLTGHLDDIVALQKAFDAYRDNKATHEPLTFIRARDDRWVRLNGLLNVDELVSEYFRAIEQ